MSLNNRAMKYVPTAAKLGHLVALGVAVEASDLEVIASSHISDVICDGNRSFVGVITRTPHDIKAQGAYSGFSSDDMISIRLHEAEKSANIGAFQALYLLNHGPLAEAGSELMQDYLDLLETYRPDIIYTYSPFDRDHEHILSLKALLSALEQMGAEYRPEHIYAVNTDGDLGEILPEEELIDLDVDSRYAVIEAMLSVYVSLTEEGMMLVPGTTALDLAPLLSGGSIDLNALVRRLLDQGRERVLANLK